MLVKLRMNNYEYICIYVIEDNFMIVNAVLINRHILQKKQNLEFLLSQNI